MTIRGSSLGTPLVALRVAAKASSDVAFRVYTLEPLVNQLRERGLSCGRHSDSIVLSGNRRKPVNGLSARKHTESLRA